MSFFSTLKSSLVSTQFYARLRAVRFRESMVFWLKFYGLILVLSLIPLIISGFIAKNLIDKYYPSNLKIGYADGVVSVEGASLPWHFSLSGTNVTVNSTAVEFTTPDGQTITDDYKDVLQGIGSFTLTKNNASSFVPEVLPAIAAAFSLAFVLFVLVFRLPLILLYSLLIRSVLALFGKRITYKEVLQMGIHASVAAELVNLIVLVIYRNGGFPMFDVAFFGIMILALRSRPTQIARIG
jgi:hypothetical protein